MQPLTKNRTKIVATLGPSSSSKEIIKSLYDSGVNIFRLNFSHGTHESHGKLIDTIHSLNLNCGIMLDTKGPEIRVGEVRDKLSVKIGDKFTMTIKKGVYEDTKKLSVNYEGFINDVDIGDIIVIDSGVIKAKCIGKNEFDLDFEVINGQCDITTKRHINLYGKKVSLPTVTEQDWKDIDFGIEKKVDFIALSFVRSGKDIIEVKDHCLKKGLNISIISKVENFESTENLEEIIKESDGLMVARGDLSCEISFGKVPSIQKKMVTLCSYYNKPVIIATQLVLSMVDNIQPTRAEVSDIGNAIFEGADAIMTSDETTKGIHPVLVIQTMAKIAKESEDSLYNLCGRPECKSCFGILYQGKIRRKGFESIVRPKPEKAHGSDNLKVYRCGHKNLYSENIITLLPKITRGIQAIGVVSNGKDFLVENCSASRIDIPIIGFSNNIMERNQWNLCWNVTPVYNMNINDRIDNNRLIVDYYMKEYGFKKYLFVGDFYQGEQRFTSVQVRNVE
jgi:pyruvate kinase